MTLKTRTLNGETTHRLIPKSANLPKAIGALADTREDLAVLDAFEQLTSARQRQQQGQVYDVDPRTLPAMPNAAQAATWGQSTISAAFAYRKMGGNRFNDERWGAWYAAFDIETSMAEVAHHRIQALADTRATHDEFSYVDMTARFLGDFPEISARNHPALNPNVTLGYAHGQALAQRLRTQGCLGLIYPSVRRPGGVCFAAFVPHLVQDVKQGKTLQFVMDERGLRWVT